MSEEIKHVDWGEGIPDYKDDNLMIKLNYILNYQKLVK